MSFLILPVRQPDEGPYGFQHRLATANLLAFGDVEKLDCTYKLEADSDFKSEGSRQSAFIKRRSRFCPRCVESRESWDIGWELLFADACIHCGCRLADTCTSCLKPVTWSRGTLKACDCGKSLASASTCLASEPVIELCRQLRSKVLGDVDNSGGVLHSLSLEQCFRLVRLLGSYANEVQRRAPQKMLNIDHLDVSWTVSSSAAAILDAWPQNFSSFLSTLRDRSGEPANGRISKVFGGFYFALYRRFKDPEFDWLRSAFESYLADNWAGNVSRRNRRLGHATASNAAWVPANRACAALGVSRRRLKELICVGALNGELRTTPNHRELMVVKRADLTAYALQSSVGLPLNIAATRLGLKKARLKSLLHIICPTAIKLGKVGCPWSIPIDWVESWEQLIASIDNAPQELNNCVSFAHVLRYLHWKDDEIAGFLNCVFTGEFKPVGRDTVVTGISSLLFDPVRIRNWRNLAISTNSTGLTVPEMATKLQLKQEVAYSLVRSGKIVSNVRIRGRRSEHFVTPNAIDEFNLNFVLCREVAKMLSTSPRAVLDSLRSAKVMPVAGPGVDDCRQFLFNRSDVDAYTTSLGKVVTPK